MLTEEIRLGADCAFREDLKLATPVFSGQYAHLNGRLRNEIEDYCCLAGFRGPELGSLLSNPRRSLAIRLSCIKDNRRGAPRMVPGRKYLAHLPAKTTSQITLSSESGENAPAHRAFFDLSSITFSNAP
jgi:hypothetical protein